MTSAVRVGYSRVNGIKLKTGILNRLCQQPTGLAGAAILILFILAAAAAPALAPYDPLEINFDARFHEPSRSYLLGTDDYGRDLLSRILYGARISLRASIVVVLLATGIGMPLGVLAGYVGGVVDELIMRLADIFFAFPGLLLAMAIVAALGPSIDNAMLAVAVTWWPGYARLVRGTVLQTKEMLFVEAARCTGASSIRIMARHVLPNSFAPVLVKMTMEAGLAILTTATLSFIGLGAPPQVPEWGAMVSQGRNYLFDHPWSATVPGLAMFVTVLGFALLGDALRDLLDPTLRRG